MIINNKDLIYFLPIFKFYYLLISVSFYAYVPVFFIEKGYDSSFIGYLFSLQSFIAILSYLPSGFINDKISVKKQIILGTIIFSLFLFILNFSTTYFHYIILFILWGISGTMIDNSTNAVYYKESQIINNKLFFALYGITGTMAYALGGKLGAYINQLGGFTILFKMLFIMSLTLIIFSILLPDTKVTKIKFKDYYDDIFSFTTFIIALNLFLFTIHWGAELSYFTILLKEKIKLNFNEISYIYFEVGLIMSLIIFSIGVFKSKLNINPNIALYFAVFLSSMSQLTIGFSKNFIHVFINQFIHAIGDAFFVYYWLNIIPKTFRYEKVGGASAFVNVFTVISVVIGSYCSALVVKYTLNPASAFVFSGSIMLLIYLLNIISYMFLKIKNLSNLKINLLEAKQINE